MAISNNGLTESQKYSETSYMTETKKENYEKKIHISSKDHFDKASYIHYNRKSDY